MACSSAASITVGGRGGFGGVSVTRQLIRNITGGATGYTASQRAAVRRVGGMAGFNRRVKKGQSTLR